MRIVGITGHARAGKDTAAEALITRGYQKYSFAAALKTATRSIFSLSMEQLHGDKKDEMDAYWGMSPREILQRFGTDAMRKEFDQDIWVRALARTLMKDSPRRVVISDVRFDNEAAFIRGYGGILIQISRPSVSIPRSEHESESGVEPRWINHYVTNDGPISSLRQQIYAIPEIVAEFNS